LARIDLHNRVRYWRDSRIPGLALLHADFTRHDYAPHSHDALVIAVTETGGSEFKSRGRTEEADAAHLLVFNPTEPHSGRMARSARWRYRSFYFDERAITAVTALLGIAATPYFTSNVFGDADLIAGFVALHHALDEGLDPARERELLVASFGNLVLRYAAEGKPMPAAPRDRDLVQRAIAVMQARLTEPLTLETVGGGIGLTPFQLIGLFKHVTGLTPHGYLTQIRLRAAIRSLREGEKIAEAAASTGFYDQAALTTHFKRAYGITPLQFVRAEVGMTSKALNFGQ
jgi:AraC-like DNA-binding protein